MVTPRFATSPKGDGAFGEEAVAWCAAHGLELDEWQAYVLVESLRKSGETWAAYEVGVNVARQNGKNAILEARELVEMFLVGSELVIHSAHLFATSRTHFRRLWARIEANDDLLQEIKPQKYGRVPRMTTGQEAIELLGDRAIRFRTRSKGASRGESCDLFVLDEAMFLPEEDMAAGFFTGSARPNPQVWYTGSAVDQQVHDEGVTFARIRERGIAGDSDLAYFEWSVGNGEPERDNPANVLRSTLEDPAAWAQANPALGIRIRPEHVQKEFKSLGPTRAFAVERLGIGDWPRTDHIANNPLDLEVWEELKDVTATMLDPVCVAFDVSPERRGAICTAGVTKDGLYVVEVIDDRNGTAWMPSRLVELKGRHSPEKIVCDGRGPVASLLPKLEELNIEVEVMDAGEHAQACGRLVDIVAERNLRHLGQPELFAAIHAASTRPLGDAWAWSRRNSSGNISPLVAATLALSAAMTSRTAEPVMAWA